MSTQFIIITPKKYEKQAKEQFFWQVINKINIRQPFSFIPEILPLQLDDIQKIIDKEHIQRADGQFILNSNFVSMEKAFDYVRENYEKVKIEIIQEQVKNYKVEIEIKE